MANINWLAVLIAAVVYFFLGSLWYQLLFRNIWARELEPGPREFTYSSDLLDRYVGNYRVDASLTIAVVRTNNQLVAWLKDSTRTNSFPIFAGSKTKFFMKTVDANLDFQTNAEGAAEGLAFYIGGETRRAKRVASGF